MPSLVSAPVVHGPRLIMVAMELLMTLFALVYAYPHIPGALIEDVGTAATEEATTKDPAGDDETEIAETQWFSVRNTEGMRGALDALLRTSEVLETSLDAAHTVEELRAASLSDAATISALFGLRLYGAEGQVPATCRQMYECIAAVYRALGLVDVTTREELWSLYKRYQLLPEGYKLPGLGHVSTANRSGLLQFCSELMVDWLQPYFSRHPELYAPAQLAGLRRGCGGKGRA